MKNVRILLPLILVLGAGLYFGYYRIWLNDDERVIHAKVDELVELAGKEGEESVFSGIGTARQIARHFTEEFRLSMGRPFPEGTSSRDELTAVVHRARESSSEIRLRVSDRDLQVDESGERAVMELTGHGYLAHRGGRGEESRRFRVEWIKEDGDWFIRTVELLDIPE